jgi:hypothetical protein
MRRRGVEVLLVAVLAVGSTTVLMHPLVARMDRVGRVNTGDGQLSLWNVAWVAHTIVANPRRLYDANIFYPHRGTLAFSEANIGAGLLAVPAWWATKNPYFAHNFAVFVALCLSVGGAYALARYLTGSRAVAVFAALAFTFSPFTYARTAHVQLLMIGGLPWCLLAWHRLVDAPSPGRALALGLALAAQALACAYYGIFAAFAVGLAVLFYTVARALWRRRAYWGAVLTAAAVSIGLVTPFFLPYLEVRRAGFARTIEDALPYSATWTAYLASPTWAHRWWLPWLGSWTDVLFPGIVVTLSGAAGLWLALRHRLSAPAASLGAACAGLEPSPTARRPGETAAFYALLGTLAAWSSFGPQGGLYWLFYQTVPLFEFLRAPSRFGILVTLALVALASLALAHLARTSGPRGRWLLAAAAVVAVLELVAVPLRIPVVDPEPPPVYRVLAKLRRGPVAEFPFFYLRPDFPRHARYMLASTAHWMPLVNGYSDHIPDDFREMVLDVSTFPSRAAFRHLQQRRVRYVVFHPYLYDVRSRQKLVERLGAYAEFLAPIYKDEEAWLYEIVAWPR